MEYAFHLVKVRKDLIYVSFSNFECMFVVCYYDTLIGSLHACMLVLYFPLIFSL